MTPRGWALELDDAKAEAPCSDPTGKCSEEKKRRFSLLFSSGYLTPRDWALELDDAKAEAPCPGPTGNRRAGSAESFRKIKKQSDLHLSASFLYISRKISNIPDEITIYDKIPSSSARTVVPQLT
ncbi:hypothetical protein D3H55_03760 [Bacillus salacetis]|uniref:Uncharacterized protein n=1 Tax=Bacillus salacetis TaxID=2315464 RepID=A0A3A1R4M5_9BACI|nr:hypothetical protein D3H55_03760 [Bacillus salacetis]